MRKEGKRMGIQPSGRSVSAPSQRQVQVRDVGAVRLGASALRHAIRGGVGVKMVPTVTRAVRIEQPRPCRALHCSAASASASMSNVCADGAHTPSPRTPTPRGPHSHSRQRASVPKRRSRSRKGGSRRPRPRRSQVLPSTSTTAASSTLSIISASSAFSHDSRTSLHSFNLRLRRFLRFRVPLQSAPSPNRAPRAPCYIIARLATSSTPSLCLALDGSGRPYPPSPGRLRRCRPARCPPPRSLCVRLRLRPRPLWTDAYHLGHLVRRVSLHSSAQRSVAYDTGLWKPPVSEKALYSSLATHIVLLKAPPSLSKRSP
ncbi:hypothetical protein DFH06DRAFT_1159480 [Mycena polygramma]|nr:hypothetical protein DFH06DRAFT_1159480 [Mycena polygramma]